MSTSPLFELATDGEFRLLAGFTSPPRPGVVTGHLPSGQVTVALDESDGGEATAWPLNGWYYAPGAVVYVAFAADNPQSGIILGAKAPLPTLSAYLRRDGTTPLSADWDVGAGRRLRLGELQARDSGGLLLTDDDGTAGIRVADGGRVGIGSAASTPQGMLHAHDGLGGMLCVSVSGINSATPRVLVPDGSGDIVRGVAYLTVVSDGTVSNGGSGVLTPGSSQDYPAGTLGLRLSCSAGGALTVHRQSGTGSGSLALLGVWL